MPGSASAIERALPETQPRLRALGRWARAIRLEDVPDDVQQHARAQLAHIHQRVAAVLATGLDLPASNSRDASAYTAFDGDGHILGGRTGAGIAVLRSLSGDSSLTVERLVLATVVGMEIGARVGLATLVSDRATSSSARPGAAAGAAALAWLGGASGDAIGDAVAIAVGLAAPATAKDGCGFGAVVAEAALGGFSSTGAASGRDHGVDPSGLWRDVAEPLPEALAPPGVGSAGCWYSRALVLPVVCAPVVLATAVEGLGEVLKRHVKAAEKRLRAEQVERVEIRVPFVTWAAEQARPRAAQLIGRFVAFHDLGPAEAALQAGNERASEVAAVAERVEIIHDWSLSVGLAQSAQGWTGPVTFGRYRALRGVLRPVGAWPSLRLPDLLALAQSRADRLLRAAEPHAGVQPLSWPVQIKLYTTRGGWWPERRHLAEAGPRELVAPFDDALSAPAGPLLGASAGAGA
ncbi:MAG: hypothetical protein EXR69_04795 [Myxococcales bacterium]|nr:hypothetical protein [Myxococcales bacterium]